MRQNQQVIKLSLGLCFLSDIGGGRFSPKFVINPQNVAL
jgi:hypothetical protein